MSFLSSILFPVEKLINVFKKIPNFFKSSGYRSNANLERPTVNKITIKAGEK